MFETFRRVTLMTCVGSLALCSSLLAETVKKVRVPDGGIQPQVAVDENGVAHLVYFKGTPDAGDLFYVTTKDGGANFSKAIQVNSGPGSAMAIGTVRGAHMALGRNGRVHVAWMSSRKADPKDPGGAPPMLYTRYDATGESFEPQRNVMQYAKGLDGGGSIAADDEGNVYVAWHAIGRKPGEENRQVYIARSSDEGKTFARETVAFSQATGACGCCGMRVYAGEDGKLYMLYRSATERVNRDMYLLVSKNNGAAFTGGMLQPWKANQCVMSTASFGTSAGQVVSSWETRGQVYFSRINKKTARPGQPVSAPGKGDGRKHPIVAGNDAGEVLLVWTEGTGWNKGGRLAWQLYSKDGKPADESGVAPGVPAWSFGAVFATKEGFTIVY